MSQDLSGGGQRAQRDKEFFPAMNESEVAKAKISVSERTIKKAAAASASGGGCSRAPGSETAEKTKVSGGLSASLLFSASTASTVKIPSDSDSENGISAAARSYKQALYEPLKRPCPSAAEIVAVSKLGGKENATAPDKAGPRRVKRRAEAAAKRENRAAAEEAFTGPAGVVNPGNGRSKREGESERIITDTPAAFLGKRKPTHAISDIKPGGESDDEAAANRPAIRARQATASSRSVGPPRRQSHLRRR